MNKIIRIAAACGIAWGLSHLWLAVMPPVAALVVSAIVGMALGSLAVLMTGPDLLPAYRVIVRDEDYQQEPPFADLPANSTFGVSDTDIKHLQGVPWFKADVPPVRHACWAQTDGWIGLDHFQRCACGAIRAGWSPEWMDRNTSRKTRVAA